MIVATCMDMSLKTLFKIIRARWNIENSIFNNLKNECGLEHCFVHGGKAVEAGLYLIFIASNIMQSFLYGNNLGVVKNGYHCTQNERSVCYIENEYARNGYNFDISQIGTISK